MDAPGTDASLKPLGLNDDQPPCPNCGTPRFGPFCYRCGQPEKGLIRQFSSILGDLADTVFNWDSRTLRTIVPLYFKPGHLTLEYFAGRRQRFVTPIRLFVFLCLLAFIAVQWSTNSESALEFQSHQELARAQSIAELDRAVQEETARARKVFDVGLAHLSGEVKAEVESDFKEELKDIQQSAQKRRQWLLARDAAIRDGREPPPEAESRPKISIGRSSNDKPWHPDNNPITVPFLSKAMNRELTVRLMHAEEVLRDPNRGPRELVRGLFEVMPQTLLVLMPLFALLLKLLYVFKRRLYMEHLMVALHSHSFLFLSIILIVLLTQLTAWAGKWSEYVEMGFGTLAFFAWAWMPVYLFWMQKRVYGQGWLMTTVKFCCAGFAYFVLAMMAFAAAFLISLLTL